MSEMTVELLRLHFMEAYQKNRYNIGDVWRYKNPRSIHPCDDSLMIVLRPTAAADKVLVGYFNEHKKPVCDLVDSTCLQEPISVVADMY